MNSCSLLLKAWEAKLKINAFGFLLRNLLLLYFFCLCLSICSSVNIVFYIKQVVFLQSVSLLHVFQDSNQRPFKISFAFIWAHLSAGSQYISSWQLHPDVLPLLFLQISSLLSKYFFLMTLWFILSNFTGFLQLHSSRLRSGFYMMLLPSFVLILPSNFMSSVNIIAWKLALKILFIFCFHMFSSYCITALWLHYKHLTSG